MLHHTLNAMLDQQRPAHAFLATRVGWWLLLISVPGVPCPRADHRSAVIKTLACMLMRHGVVYAARFGHEHVRHFLVMSRRPVWFAADCRTVCSTFDAIVQHAGALESPGRLQLVNGLGCYLHNYPVR
jgi:hypothetical protein